MNLGGLDAEESDFLRVVLALTGGRRCSRCHLIRDLDDFPAKGVHGATQCKECRAEITRNLRGNARAHVAGVGYVYRLRDAAGALLYVGLTRHPEGRFYGAPGGWGNSPHALVKEWWPEVAEISVDTFAAYEDARAAEAWAIRYEAPRHNRQAPQTTTNPRPLSTVRGAPRSA